MNCPNDVGAINEKIDLWQQLLAEAKNVYEREPALSEALRNFVLERENFADALAARIARKISYTDKEYVDVGALCREAFVGDPFILIQSQNDIAATVERDPACENALIAFLWFKGFLAIATYRVAHYFWTRERRFVAAFLQSRSSEILAVDIHPAAKIGCGIFLDHATGFVAGETAVLDNNVSILHAVTLGGNGKEVGNRHPKVRSGVLIGAGAKILGNITIGECAKIGAGSVVLEDVPAHTTVAGVPAKIVGVSSEADPALAMNHKLS
ncbi:MAG: serine O-acetyltransferase [Opitutales bacterium]|nr:serine O-acetyltransferase [Opitutales bacterium]